ncbi:MAG: GTPase ObgE [Dethiobacteria bacterium]
MFLDEVTIEVNGGRGGDGALSFRREKHVPHGGPDGGDGGKGGAVILKADSALHTLLDFRYRRRWKAADGGNGGRCNCRGHRGEDLIIPVPVGTVVRDEDGTVLADLIYPDVEIVVAEGGRGGFGNRHFVSSRRRTPRLYEKGEPGAGRKIVLELKLIADVALVGFPNAGKSTLLAIISAARPKIADYPFTTLAPHLGVVKVGEDSSFVVVDLPGLIEGAHGGAGRGDLFLRHAERSLILLHLIDVSEMADGDPLERYDLLNKEIDLYSPELSRKPQVVVGNKVDLPGGWEQLERMRHKLRQGRRPEDAEGDESPEVEVRGISAATGEGVSALIKYLALEVNNLRKQKREAADMVKTLAIKPDTDSSEKVQILKEGDSFRVRGGRIERLTFRTDFENEEALRRFRRYCKRINLDLMLRDKGACRGDTVIIGEYEFIFDDRGEGAAPPF